MSRDTSIITETLFIRNLTSNCCMIMLRERLEGFGIKVNQVQPGKASLSYDRGRFDHSGISGILQDIGMEVMESRENVLVESIKQTVIELIHHLNNVDSVVRKSDYLVQKLGYSYQHLSKTFSANEPVTLERFVILHKIERIKELVDIGEYTLSEIAYMMDYSSVQYLSNQFHKITGMNVSDYKLSDRSSRKPIDNIY
jgi:AraC family transcriptional regulator